MIRHIKRWNKWRILSRGSMVYKFLVLIKLIHAPSMYWMVLSEDMIDVMKILKK